MRSGQGYPSRDVRSENLTRPDPRRENSNTSSDPIGLDPADLESLLIRPDPTREGRVTGSWPAESLEKERYRYVVTENRAPTMSGDGHISQGKTSSGQGCQTDRPTLKPSSLASVKVNYWQKAVGQRAESAVS